jgi:uncharacterized delta-60 repeat protein
MLAVCALAVLATARPAAAQAFTDIGASLTGVYASSVAWGDYDNDGDLDFLLTGCSSTRVANIYRNDGGGAFAVIDAGLIPVRFSSVAWGDYDNDGDLDILLTGDTDVSRVTRVYRNNGDGTFADTAAGLTDLSYSSVAWGDYDNDGDLDILLAGSTGLSNVAKIYRNDGNGAFCEIATSLASVANPSAAWGDYDNDGDLDILLAGSSSAGPVANIYRSDGNGVFTNIPAGLAGVTSSSVAWGDYDSDGRLDILLTGADESLPALRVAKVYHGDGGGVFTDIVANLTGVSASSAAWGDYDNDGDLDILLTGSPDGTTGIADVYRNNGDGTFTDIAAGLTGVYYSSVAWGDYDNDGDLDILLTGMTSSTLFARIYRNNITVANTAPAAPTGLGTPSAADHVTLSWSATNDPQTPPAGLTYNVRIGSSPRGGNILSPMAVASDGWRRVPQLGNAGHGTSAVIKGLAPGTYYWSVQAIDGGLAGSPFATESTFSVCTASLDPTSASVPPLGGSGAVAVYAPSACTWAGSSDNPWLTVTSGVPGSGNGTVGYSVAPNTGPARTGRLAIGGQLFTVNQQSGAFPLTVSKSGPGRGVVTSLPAGIDCGATCSALFADGSLVTLSAAADPGSSFVGWSGACSGSGACVATMDAARSVTAAFTCTGVGSFATTSPVDGESFPVGTTSVGLLWETATNATSYDLYFGLADPPPLFASSLTTTSHTVTVQDGHQYLWRVLARSSCAGTWSTGERRTFSVQQGTPSPGMLDLSFAPALHTDGQVRAIAVQPDGKVVIGGSFSHVAGNARPNIARLNADGSLDSSFNAVAEGTVNAIALEPDGTMIIGWSSMFNSIARLNPDGSRDLGFAADTGSYSSVFAIALQPDGRVIIGGSFTYVNSVARRNIARLNSDGTLDHSFDPGTGASNTIYALSLQPDGKLVIGGSFTSFNGTAANRIARLAADGPLDPTFNPGTGASGTVGAIALQADGKLLVAGSFLTYNGTARGCIARIIVDGDLDGSFNPGGGANSSIVALALQPDGRIVIGGAFTSYSGTARNRIARLDANGNLDPTFVPGSGANGILNALALQPDGKALAGGAFTSLGGIARPGIARIEANGTLDATFTTSSLRWATGLLSAVTVQPDGKILIGGSFTYVNGTPRTRVARLNLDGTLDPTFDPGIGTDNYVATMAVQSDGKILIGGGFASFNGVNRRSIARLNPNGSLDWSFDPGTGTNNTVSAVAVQPDGKILLAGSFTGYNGVARGRLARVNTDGTLDGSFDPGTGANGTISRLALQPDGRVLLSGGFASYNGTTRNRIARASSDGTLDSTFDPGTGPSGTLSTLALLPDGTILIGGWFTSYNGAALQHIARLNPDGTLDTSFDPGTGADSFVDSIALQSDGKAIIGGGFRSYNGTTRNRLARINPDGSLDTSFDAGSGPNGSVSILALEPSGRALAGGVFSSLSGYQRSCLARVHGSSYTLSASRIGAGNGTITSVPAGISCGSTCSAELAAATAVTLTATPELGAFIGWSGACSGTGPCALTMDSAKSVVAAFEPQPSYALTVGKIGTGSGTVASDVGGINCGATCSATLSAGSIVTLTATPAAGSAFVGWSGACTGLGACQLSMVATRGVTAHFCADAGSFALVSPLDGQTFPVGTTSVTLVWAAAANAFGYDLYFGTADPPPLLANTLATTSRTVAVVDGHRYYWHVVARSACAGSAWGGGERRSFSVEPGPAAPGLLDLPFAPELHADGEVRAIALQPDGKVVIGGVFSHVAGSPRRGIARLNSDGTLDSTFNPGLGTGRWPNNTIDCLAVQPDGKVLIGGSFTIYNGTVRNRIARLNTDGTLDTTFHPGAGPNGTVSAIVVQQDGMILIGGLFTQYNGIARGRIARLTASGALDPSFDPGTGADSSVLALALQPDGKVILGGWFNQLGGTSRSRIGRLNTSGSVDTTFNPGANGAVYSVALQPDGTLLCGGAFTTLGGAARTGVGRLGADGSLDSTFDPGTGAFVQALLRQPDGRVLIGGTFTSYNGVARNRIARLEASGALDPSFDPGSGADFPVLALAAQSDGTLLVGGAFTSFGGVARPGIARVDTNGTLDPAFSVGSLWSLAMVNSVVVQPDGKIMIGGSFTRVNGVARARIARLLADGSVDTSFDPGAGANDWVIPMALAPDGKIVIGGSFSQYNGASRGRIARLNTDGTLDASFNPGSGADSSLFSIAVQPGGKILVGGLFTSFNGTPRNRIARLAADGSLDTSFDPGSGANNLVLSIALQPDGRVLLGGAFTAFNGVARNRIARLNADGSLDGAFDPGAGASSDVYAAIPQPDGKIVIGGSFTTYNGTARSRIARLSSNGSLDATFNPGTTANAEIYAATLQPDGRILLGGRFMTPSGVQRGRVARLNSDGTLDATFAIGAGPDDYASVLTMQGNGRVLVGGNYTTYDGHQRWSLARLHNSSHTLSVSRIGAGTGTVTSVPAGISCGSTCAGEFAVSSLVTLTATPTVGAFTGWSGACSGTGTCQVTMDGAKAVVAAFELQPAYTLTVSKSGTGSGTVTSDIGGIDCGATCSASIAANAVVTLTATPAAGSVFSGWSGACSGAETCQVAMATARSVTASFSTTHTLTVAKNGTGAGSVTSVPAGIDCGSQCSADFLAGTAVALIATPQAGSSFSGWSGETCSGTGLCYFTMTQARDVTATFALTWPTNEVVIGTHVPGSSAPWTTDLVLQNLDSGGATCQISFLRSSSSPVMYTLTLPEPEGVLVLHDIVLSTFGVASESGGLEVRCTNKVAVRSRVSSSAGPGQSFVGLGDWGRLTTGAPVRIIGATENADMRTNLWLVNQGDDAATVRVDALNETGTQFGSGTYTLPARTYLVRSRIIASFTSASISNAVLVASLTSGSGPVAVIGSEVDNLSGDPATLAAMPAAGSTETLVMPAFRGSLSGAEQRSDLYVMNPGTSSATVQLELTLTDGTVVVQSVNIAAGNAVLWNDAIDTLFGLSSGTGVIRASSTTPILAQVRVWSPGVAGAFHEALPGLPESQLSGRLLRGSTWPGLSLDEVRLVTTGNAAASGAFAFTPPTTPTPAGSTRSPFSLPSAGAAVTASGTPPLSDGTSMGEQIVDGSAPFQAFSLQVNTTTGDPAIAPLSISEAPRPVIVASHSAGQITLDAYPRWSGTTWSWYEDGSAVPGGTTEQLLATTGSTYHVVATNSVFTGAGRSRPVAAALYSLSVSRNGAGTGSVVSSPAGISCPTACSADYITGAVVTLTATAETGSVFAGWTGEGCIGTAPCEVAMTQARTVVATFVPEVTLTVTRVGAGAGAVTSSPVGIDCGSDCSESYATGTVVTLTATAAAGSTFAGWSGEGCSRIGACEVTMSQARAVTAMFVSSVASAFYPLTPCRVFDTRVDSGSTAGAPVLGIGERRLFTIAGHCGVPLDATAISANLTVVGATAIGDLRVTGGHVLDTITSALSIPLSRARANNAVIELSANGDGTIAVTNPTAGTVHVILDVNGYFK